jgi:hypothetical protein
MKDISQIQSAHEPAEDKVSSAYQDSSPGAQMNWGEKHASQYVENNDQVAREIIGFHDGPRGLFKQKSEILSNNRVKAGG